MQLKGSQTEKNLLIAFAGESQARNRYTYYAGEARKAGYEYIAAIFQETRKTKRSTPRSFSSTWGKAPPKSWPGIPFTWGTP